MKRSENSYCPYCGHYCSPFSDEYAISKRKTKQRFHLACYMQHTRKAFGINENKT